MVWGGGGGNCARVTWSGGQSRIPDYVCVCVCAVRHSGACAHTHVDERSSLLNFLVSVCITFALRAHLPPVVVAAYGWGGGGGEARGVGNALHANRV